MSEPIAADPGCEKCHGTGVLIVPYVRPGGSDKTHEARCMCTFPALRANRETVREIFTKLAQDWKERR